MSEVVDFWVADHAKHATRMLPGGMYIIGIFIVSNDEVFPTYEKKIRSIVAKMQTQLTANPCLFASPENPEKLVLNYVLRLHDYSCFSVDPSTGQLQAADFKFSSQTTKWHQLECKYELDQVFPIPLDESDWDLRKHMQIIVEGIDATLRRGVFLFDGDIKAQSDNLESLVKKKKLGVSGGGKGGGYKAKTADDHACTQISIYVPCDCFDGRKAPQAVGLGACAGQIKVNGQIACKLWLHPKVTLEHAKRCVVEDLVRSLTARLEMHWDSLIEEEHGSPEDTNSIHEPPRRVMVPLPSSAVTLSDYLFPGEGPSEMMISLQELLDIRIDRKHNVVEVEGQADLNELYPATPGSLSEADSEETMIPELRGKTNRFIYLVGLGVAVLVLIVSLLINYLQNK